MGCPVLKTPEQLDVRLMPANTNGAPGEIAKQLAEMYGLQKQRHNTMDGSSPSNFDHRTITALAQTPHIALSVIPSQSNDMRDEDLTMDQLNLQLDLIEKAGDMVDQMADAIAEIVNNIDNYSPEHIEQILTVVENTHKLDMVNDGRIALPTAEIEKLATETMEAMEQLFKDDVLPPTLKEAVLPIIEKTAAIFQIPSLDTRIQEFKQNTSEVSKLTKTIEVLKTSLAELLLQDDLPEELREEIEEKLEQLDALEEGEPLPRELIKELDALSEKITQVEISQLKESLTEILSQDDLDPELRKEVEATLEALNELKDGEPIPDDIAQTLQNLSEKIDGFDAPKSIEIKAQIEAVKEQNILARAEIYNISPAQVRAIDSYMDKLDVLQENLPNNEDAITLKDMIAEALIALDKNPSSIEAMAAVETVAAHIADPKLIQHIIEISPEPTLLQKIFPILQTQSKFVVKTQTDSIAKNQNTSTARVREASTIYRTLSQAKNAIKALIPVNTNRNDTPKASNADNQPSSDNAQKSEIFTNDAPTSRTVILQKLTNQINNAQKALNKSIDSVSTTIELGMLATSKTFQQMTQRLEPLRQTPEQFKNFLTTNIQAIAKKFEAPALHPAGCPCCKTAFGRAAHLPVIGGIAKKLDIIISNVQQAKETNSLRRNFKTDVDLTILNGPKQSTLQKLKEYLQSGCGGKSCASCGACGDAFKKANGVKSLLQKVSSLFGSKSKPQIAPPSTRGASILKPRQK
jgi:hypothetical protein